MIIVKIYGLMVPASKDEKKSIKIKGLEVTQEQKLFSLISKTFIDADKNCDIEIKMQEKILETGNTSQENEFHAQLLKLHEDFSFENCKWFGEILAKNTDKTTKDGILFIILGKDENNSRLFFCRIPAETGITVENKLNSIKFDVKEDVYVKNSKKYKADFFDEIDDFVVGYATDKQVTDSYKKVKSMSDYWIKDFLHCEIAITPQRGSKMLSEAIRKTIETSENEFVKQELVSVTSTIPNMNEKVCSFESFFELANLSENTKIEVLEKLQGQDLASKFQLNSEVFMENCSYKIIVLDNGAMAIASTSDFDNVWTVTDSSDGLKKLSTSGKMEKTKLKQKVFN